MSAPQDGPLGRLVQRTLEIGIAFSVLLLTAGLVLTVALGGFGANALVGTARPAATLAGADGRVGTAIVLAGVLVLVFTPIVRVGLSLGWFALARDRAYTAITALVLAVLALTVWIGLVL